MAEETSVHSKFGPHVASLTLAGINGVTDFRVIVTESVISSVDQGSPTIIPYVVNFCS